jgi:hypothetical protein
MTKIGIAYYIVSRYDAGSLIDEYSSAERIMRARAILTVLTFCFVGAGVCFGQGTFMGTWKLKETKSEFSPGAPKNSTVVYEAEGDKVKVTVDSVSATASRRITCGEASSTVKSTRSLATRCQMRGHTL